MNTRFVSITPLPTANSIQTVPRPRHMRHENATRPDSQIEDKYPASSLTLPLQHSNSLLSNTLVDQIYLHQYANLGADGLEPLPQPGLEAYRTLGSNHREP